MMLHNVTRCDIILSKIVFDGGVQNATSIQQETVFQKRLVQSLL